MILVFFHKFSPSILNLERIFRCIMCFNRQDLWFTEVLFTWVCRIASQKHQKKKKSSCSRIHVRSQHSSTFYKPRTRMLAHKPHHSMYLFLGQKLKYQIFSCKNQIPVNPVLRPAAGEPVDMHNSCPSIPLSAITHLRQHY